MMCTTDVCSLHEVRLLSFRGPVQGDGDCDRDRDEGPFSKVAQSLRYDSTSVAASSRTKCRMSCSVHKVGTKVGDKCM